VSGMDNVSVMAKSSSKEYLLLFKKAFDIFKENHPIKFASAIAYFSLFALPSIFLISVVVLGLFFGSAEVLRELEEQLRKVIGPDGAHILALITQKYGEQASQNALSTAFYTVVVFWLSTQLFRLFQNSLNDLWDVKPDYKGFWQRIWAERGLTFILVLSTGLLALASVGIEWAVGLAASPFPGEADTESGPLAMLVDWLAAVLVFLWFSVLYKVLPAVRIKWEPTFVGAAVTSVLFFIGIWLLWNFVVERDLEDLYDFVAPIILVALWIFYSSLVFLYGASFTQAYAQMRNKHIDPAPYAFKYKMVKDKRYGDE
jgi:membrane protein